MSTNYLELPVIKTSDLISNSDMDIEIKDIPEKYKNININSELEIIINNKEDFINAMQC